MASITVEDIQTFPAAIWKTDLGTASSNEFRRSQLSGPDNIAIREYHPDFAKVTGSSGQPPLFSSLLTSDNPLFYKGCAYLPEQDELFVTSDLLPSTSSSKLPVILISRISFQRTSIPNNPGDGSRMSFITAAKWQKLRPPAEIPMPSGVIPHQKGVLFCSQGTREPQSGGLWYMPLGRPPVAVLRSFFGRPFNSLQDITRGRGSGDAGALWFTDSAAGFEHELRPHPRLPGHVYRFDPGEGELRVVADGFGSPAGVALSPGEDTAYVTDTAAARPDGSVDPTLPATIYAFDILERSGSLFLANRRVFAYAADGVPTSVRCDPVGNVYASCGDGIEVWSPGGLALGLIEVPGGCSGFTFGRDGELFICALQNLWRVQLESGP